jgi:hypothetical protein
MAYLPAWTRVWFLHRVEGGNSKVLVPSNWTVPPSHRLCPKLLSKWCCLKRTTSSMLLPRLIQLFQVAFLVSANTALKEHKKAIIHAGSYDVAPVHGTYLCSDLDFRLCQLQLGSTICTELPFVVRTSGCSKSRPLDCHLGGR